MSPERYHAEIAAWKAWRAVCAERQVRWDAALAKRKMSTSEIIKLLRLMAGINASDGGLSRVPLNEEYGGGKAGGRSCSPSLWDNAVRAYEEDR